MTYTLPQAVFWDWDGTIADSYSFLNDAHNHTLTQLGFPPFNGDEYREYFGKPREVLYPAIYKDKAEEAKEIFQSYVFENAHKVKIIDGCREVLDFFKNHNIPMGVVSNKKASFIKEEMKHADLEKYFCTLIGAGDALADKPSSKPLDLAIETSGISAEYKNIWLVGDTENDLACATAANAVAIFYDDGHQASSLIEQYNPYFTFKNYQDFKEFLVAI